MVFRDPREGVRQDGGMQPPRPRPCQPSPLSAPTATFYRLNPRGGQRTRETQGCGPQESPYQGTEQAWKDGDVWGR